VDGILRAITAIIGLADKVDLDELIRLINRVLDMIDKIGKED